MADKINKGPLGDGGNFIVHKNNVRIHLKNNGLANIESILELVKISNDLENDFWAVVEKPINGEKSNYKNFNSSITENINGKSFNRILHPIRRPVIKNESYFEHYIDFERSINKKESVTLTFSYDRPIKELITEKGLFFRNRVVLYVSSFGVDCKNLTVEIVPSKKLFKRERKKNHHCENIHANDDIFYTNDIEKHREYVVQQFLTWKLIPPFFERFSFGTISALSSAFISVICSVIFYDKLKLIVSKYVQFF